MLRSKSLHAVAGFSNMIVLTVWMSFTSRKNKIQRDIHIKDKQFDSKFWM
jgi:hypothetical protein